MAPSTANLIMGATRLLIGLYRKDADASDLEDSKDLKDSRDSADSNKS